MALSPTANRQRGRPRRTDGSSDPITGGPITDGPIAVAGETALAVGGEVN